MFVCLSFKLHCADFPKPIVSSKLLHKQLMRLPRICMTDESQELGYVKTNFSVRPASLAILLLDASFSKQFQLFYTFKFSVATRTKRRNKSHVY